MTDTIPPTAAFDLEPATPNWYPVREWETDPAAWFYVPPADRAAYAAVPLDDANVRNWMTPTKAITAGVVTARGLPDGLRWVDVADGPGPDGEPTQMGYLQSDGGWAAVAAMQHSHALAEVRQAREAATIAAAADAASRVACAVCGGRPYRWAASTVAGVHVCGECAPALTWARGQVAAARVLPDGRTAGDAALTVAGGIPTAAAMIPPGGSPDLTALPVVSATRVAEYVGGEPA